ncbi:mannonate dehydratase [Sedimenticola hydrogenitrophicus]|uniref:mannonate dehydratase n=1 Tax=Sedimenticola hydrogenitrophicus TaxID=2967975 RepID=UPI0023B1BE7C|nr:mannonate dehydratase [Sedimenticola hydrogenitrophicus]
MKESWRWYGELDRISLPEIAQTGALGIVTALHDIPYGEVWERAAIAKRNAQIVEAGFEWVMVESLSVHEDIKRGEGDLERLFANYRQSMSNLASEGIKTICYNFMPLIDWTRTDLAAPVARGGACLRFDAPRMAAFEIHMLGRKDAVNDYPEAVVEQGGEWFRTATAEDQAALLHAIMSGLPGAYDRYSVTGLRTALRRYEGIGRDELRSNFRRFLNEVVPTAEELGMRLCVHPDDPPRDILGLSRIVSCEADIAWIMDAVPARANGLTLCAGSLGAGPENDIPAIAARFADRIHFAHLRNIRHDPDQSGSFEEAAHLNGGTDMVSLIHVLLEEETRRREAGLEDAEIPFRPDHGHDLLSDIERGAHPGYSLIGRMRGLAELRGVIAALEWSGKRELNGRI